MSNPSDSKFALTPYPPISHQERSGDDPREQRFCALCEAPIAGKQPPVLLTSGRSVHLDCYLALRQHQHERTAA
jgi:hypothetical protein